jgi:hypothetical protein
VARVDFSAPSAVQGFGSGVLMSRIGAGDQYRLRELERALGKELADDDVVKRLEFVRTYDMVTRPLPLISHLPQPL